MKYFNVTVMQKGKKRLESIKSDTKMSAIKLAKEKFPSAVVVRAEETSAPLEESFSAVLE